MHYLAISMLALVCWLGNPAAGAAQVAGDSTVRTGRLSRIDLWITQPVAIKLSTDQQLKFDSIKARYTEESVKVREQLKERRAPEMESVSAMLQLGTRYQNLVRAILTAEQRPVFEKNVREAKMGW